MKRKSAIRRDTPKAIERLHQEALMKEKLCRRAGGVPYQSAFHKGVLIGVGRSGGRCEDCGGLPMGVKGELEMSHELSKGQGGETSEENCKMLCSKCHSRRHNLRNIYNEEPMWSKEV